MTRRRTLGVLLGGLGVASGGLAARPGLTQPRGAAGGDAAHRVQIDVPIVADDPAAVPLTVAVDHPMEAGHYIRSLEVRLETDPVPPKGQFLFTPASGRASVAYQIRSGQGGELRAVAECTRHGRFETRELLRVAPGGCALPPGAESREEGGNPTVRTGRHGGPGAPVPVWASLRHTSHTGLVERRGRFVPERAPFFVERVLVFVADRQVSEFRLTPAVSADPKLRFFVRAEPGQAVRVVFLNNRGQRWEASQRVS